MIRKQTLIETTVEEAWDALRDFGALHERLAPGFATDTVLDGEDRVVTFFNGAKLRERLVAIDDEARRLVWSIVDGPYTYHEGAAQVFGYDDTRVRFVWTAHLLPDELADRTAQMMERGLGLIKEALERPRASAAEPVG